MPASTSARSPRSNFSAADRTSSFDASSFVAMSASLNWIAWCLLIGTPNVSRSCEYLIAASNAARATPDGTGRDVDAAELERTRG